MNPGDSHLQAFPGATTCVAVGPLTATAVARLPAGRALLWIAPDGATPASPLPAGLVLHRAPAEDDAALGPALEAFLRLDPRHLPALLVTPEASAATNERIEAHLATVTAVLEKHHRARVTRQRDGFTWQRHVLLNAGPYSHRPVPAGWKDRLDGRPAVVCGAGPSLDVTATALAAIGGRVVIFAADSALHTLAKHGITADFVVSVDAAKEPAKCLPPGRHPPHAVLAPVSPPAWTSALPAGSVAFAASNQITTDWLATLGVPRPPVAVAENCGVTALELARWLGCTPIHLFGLDLALAPGAKRHAAGADASLYTGSGFDAGQTFPEVPGNHAPTVPTHVIGDWRALDARLARWPAGLVVNVNDRGARLANTTLVHPAEFHFEGPADKIAWLDNLPPVTPAGEAPTVGAALARIRQAGDRCAQALPALRAALAAGGPAAVVAQFRPLLADPVLGRVLGGYALKLMPHLVPPVEGDLPFWEQQLAELEELAGLASRCR